MGNILYHHTKASKADWYSEFPCQAKPAKDMRMKVEYQSRPYESIPVVPHKAVAEVSRIGNVYRRD